MCLYVLTSSQKSLPSLPSFFASSAVTLSAALHSSSFPFLSLQSPACGTASTPLAEEKGLAVHGLARGHQRGLP